MDEFLGLIKSYGVARLAAIIGATFGVAAALALIIVRIGEPPMTVLYADLDFRDAQTVVNQLEQDGVRHELRESGAHASILVPRDEADRLRLSLAADGLVAGSGVGYEIFDNEKALGATTFQQNINRLRALEGELARTISSISGVRSARVHLVLPKRELFERDRQEASASIVVDAPGGLDNRTVRAIVNLTASAVPALKPERVTLLDDSGALLASGETGDDAVGAGVEDRIREAEARIRRAVEDMVGRIVGPENVRVQVAADMSLNRVSESAEIIDPDSQTVLSSNVVEETSNNRDPADGRGVTVANALPGATPVEENEQASTSATQRTEEVTNYQISKTVRNAVRDEGLAVKRLSVAVAINGASPAPGESGAYVPRSPQELQRIETLVKSAIGFDANRGDQVDVVNIRFEPPPAVEPVDAAAPAASLTTADAMRIGEIGALALIALALIVFVLRPLFAAPAKLPAPSGAAAPAQIAAQPASTAAPAALAGPRESALEQKIDLAQVEGQVKASSIRKVTEIVKGHTDESAGILKNWIRGAA